MSDEFVLQIWRSTQVIMALCWVILLLIIATNMASAEVSQSVFRDLVMPAAGFAAFAILLAEICRRMLNFFAGKRICHWRGTA